MAYPYVGGTLKTNVKEIYHPLVYIIESAILNQHLSFSKEKKYKNSKQKNRQVTASLYTKKFTSLSI